MTHSELLQKMDDVLILKSLVKARSLCFQADEKSSAALLLGLGFDDLLDLSYDDWTRLNVSLSALKEEAEADFTGPGNTQYGVIWKNYADNHPEKVAAIVSRLNFVGESPTFS